MVATASHAKHDFVRSLGAEPIDYQSIDFRQGIRNLGLDGVDVVFDCTTPANFNRSYDVLNRDGLLIFSVCKCHVQLFGKNGFAL